MDLRPPIVRELLRSLGLGIADAEVEGLAIFLIAGLEGLSLERLDRGDSPALSRARRLFVESATAAIERA